jgi:hypothetical protein
MPLAALSHLSDDEMIGVYTICSCCGERVVSDDHLPRLIAAAKDAEDFVRRVNRHAMKRAN